MRHNHEPQGGLWTFESEPDALFDVPTRDELADQWTMRHGGTTASLSGNYFGVFDITDTMPSAFISLDLCEVVRQTGNSLQLFRYSDQHTLAAENPSATSTYDAFYSSWQNNSVSNQDMNRLALQQIMHGRHVQPVPFAEAIQAFLQRWKQAGVYTIANTSTLPGCERSTIDFLAEHYPSSVNGILLPRNHDGRGSVTKPGILQETKNVLAQHVNFDASLVPTLAIEDGEHHVKAFIEETPDVAIFTPEYFWNEQFDDTPSVTRVAHGLGTIDTFMAVDNHLRARGIVE